MKPLVVTSTLSGTKEPFKSAKNKHVELYVCGITPYDFAHVGHGRCYVTFDLLVRVLAILGYSINYCRNFTDVDDKLINRAREQLGDGARYPEIAEKFIAAYHEDMRALNCLRPSHEPRVTQTIPEIITFVEGLIAKGNAYVVNGDVYFSIASFPEYGKLSKRSLDDLLAGARVAINDEKKNPLDFALWKKSDDGIGFESPWGLGRPGWHIECSAMSKKFCALPLDIHAGGMDLIFPHHENEIAQSEALDGSPFSRIWMHNAFVRIDQEKMSKSLGNFFTLRDLFAKMHPMVVRYMILTHHYRSPLDFSWEDLESVAKSYQRIAKLLHAIPLQKCTREELEQNAVTRRMLEYMCDDLNTPGALGVLFESIAEIRDDQKTAALTAYLLRNLFGLTLELLPEKAVEITPEIQKLIEERESARREKDFKRADEIREKLRTLGYEVRDSKKP